MFGTRLRTEDADDRFCLKVQSKVGPRFEIGATVEKTPVLKVNGV